MNLIIMVGIGQEGHNIIKKIGEETTKERLGFIHANPFRTKQ